VVLVQLGDLHIGADWVDTDPRKTLSATIEAVLRLNLSVTAVLALGDLAETASDEEYADAQVALARLDAPIHAAMGNHDDRAKLRRHFGLRPSGDASVRYAIDLGPVRLLVLDTTIPDADAGRLDQESLKWLDGELSNVPDTPTLLAMHHPPLVTGEAAFDRIGLNDESRVALAEILGHHPQVHRILGAHLHRPLLTQFAACPLLVAPSTYVQFPLGVRATRLVAGNEPPGFVAHMIRDDGSVISAFHAVTGSTGDLS
jgi:3',5'-cyclic AMP phosphodiesterase CpdA